MAFFAKALLLIAFLVFPLMSVKAQSVISPLDRYGYVREFLAALPEGTDHQTASTKDFEAAVQKVVLAHPPEKAPAIAYAITSLVGLDRVKEVAEAIAKLFEEYPALRELVTDIAKAMTDAVRARIGPVAAGDGKGGDFKDIAPLGDHPAIMEQIDQTVSDVLSVFSDYLGYSPDPVFPVGVQPGEIQSHETPIINL